MLRFEYINNLNNKIYLQNQIYKTCIWFGSIRGIGDELRSNKVQLYFFYFYFRIFEFSELVAFNSITFEPLGVRRWSKEEHLPTDTVDFDLNIFGGSTRREVP